MAAPGNRSSMDDVIDAYKAGIDRTLLRANLRLTHEERLLQLIAHQEFAREIRRAGRALRRAGRVAETPEP